MTFSVVPDYPPPQVEAFTGSFKPMIDKRLEDISIEFAVDIVELVKQLKADGETVMSDRLCRCATAIGAGVNMADYDRCSDEEVASLVGEALRQADESLYWLELLYRTGYLSDQKFQALLGKCGRIRWHLMRAKEE